jgi:hypothetical protein
MNEATIWSNVELIVESLRTAILDRGRECIAIQERWSIPR